MTTTKEVDELISLQDELFDQLERSIKNYKKTAKEKIKLPYLLTRLELLEQLFTDFKEGHKAIVLASQDRSDAYFTQNTYDIFEDNYVEYKAALREVIERLSPSAASSSAPATDTAAAAAPGSSAEIKSEVKLPQINLPTFSGRYEEWQTFYDMFSSLIHKNQSITAVQKLHYLKSYLTGEAKNLLSNFSTTEANYEEAWKQLVKRYNNKRYNSNAILRSLFAMRKINTESAGAVKNLLDTTSTCLKSLQNMGIDTSSWDAIIVFFVVSKLDTESMRQWEQHVSMVTDELPTWEQLREYLEHRFRSLEMIDTNVTRPNQPAKPVTKAKIFHTAIENKQKSNDVECAMCHENHYIYHCKRFGLMTPNERQEYVQSNRLCFNCLSPTHAALKCRQSSCRKCGRRHHTMLHFERVEKEARREGTSANEAAATASPSGHERPSTSQGDTHITAAHSRGEMQPNSVLLATARVKVFNSTGCKQIIRALLDQGSQASFVTEATVQLLGLTRKPVSGWVSGLGDGRMRIKHTVSLRVESRHSPESSIQVNAYVLHSLTSLLPAAELTVPEWSEIGHLPLADPTYTKPGKIDVLLGAEVYAEILQDGLIKQSEGSLLAQNTIFGWILSGRAARGPEELAKANVMSMHVQVKEDDLLKKFWEMENEPNTIHKEMTKSEKRCEEIFDATTVRDDEGRLVVRLPFTTEDPKSQYGNSKEIAIKRLEILERKLKREPKLREEYNKVFEEYLSLNHMRKVNENELENPKAVYLPHHAVVREDKETTKVRIVFDASSKGTNNVSLNDDLLVGPKLQQDLRHILMRWRRHKVCIVADIVKMYRMVRVADEDTDFQRIVWRFSSDESQPIQHYKLLRLTFGTACAPYLAVKCLQRLAELEESKYPLAAKLTRQDFYMDDLITGAETEDEVMNIYNEMNELLRSGGFELQKWNSNSETVLQKIRKTEKTGQEQEKGSDSIKLNKSIKVLGVSWNRDADSFEYMLKLPEPTDSISKRQVLSDVARLYDPLGWIAPVIVLAKILIQKLWQSGLEWDDRLTEDLLSEWLAYRRGLVDLTQLKLPRWYNATQNSKIELHVFSDASKSAFAAAVYVRVIDECNQVHVHLLTAKTKVAPIEKEISIPRLELCGSTLAAKLISEVSQVMEIPKEDLYGWTDSTIVLAWLKGGSSRWTTFVSNRVSTILNIMEYEQWGHVSSETNPADCASRGMQPHELLQNSLWWNGPQWLSEPNIESDGTKVEDTHEEERVKALTVLSKIDEEEFIWTRFSSLSRMLRVLSYCRRILNLKIPETERAKLTKFVTVEETNETLLCCVKEVQRREYESEIKQLKTRGCVPKKSNLRTLCPFLDEKGTLRVQGRIAQSDACYDTKHPIIMPAKDHLTKLIIVDAHHQTMHGGPQIMLNFLRAKFWIIHAKEQVKKVYRECVICLRYTTKKTTPFMGLLPEARLKPSKPFRSTGVDYCGPINIRFSPGRGAKSYKGYICLFVCMVTRAVHLEAVTDLTAKGFIAAFRRFTARRGHCQDLYSDNGTNFVGADREMRDMFNSAKSSLTEEIASLLTLERTTWHFIPPHSPNFGGLWESGVRSTKTHLRKVVGNSTLTYEEMSTVLAQVEACLNSRPISVLSDDPSDPLPLTPGHFLVGEPLLNLADDDYTKFNVQGLDRWRLTQKIVNDFWNRWYKEYLVNLNQRYKWNTKSVEPEIGDIVILKEDNLPPAKWVLGKIILKHTGPDNITRVVSVKCKSGVFKRPVSKICVITK